jgi:hypothetical protein
MTFIRRRTRSPAKRRQSVEAALSQSIFNDQVQPSTKPASSRLLEKAIKTRAAQDLRGGRKSRRQAGLLNAVHAASESM